MKYDRQQAIEAATDVFWQQGYQGTKMRDLQVRLDMRPGSIYAGFGNKQGLFKDVLDHYVALSIAHIDRCCQHADNPLLGLKHFMRAQLLEKGKPENVRICLLVKTLSELDEQEPELCALAKQGLQKIEQRFELGLVQAAAQGLLKDRADPARLAKWLQMQVMGLRIYAKNFSSPAVLEQMIEDTFSSLAAR